MANRLAWAIVKGQSSTSPRRETPSPAKARTPSATSATDDGGSQPPPGASGGFLRVLGQNKSRNPQAKRLDDVA